MTAESVLDATASVTPVPAAGSRALLPVAPVPDALLPAPPAVALFLVRPVGGRAPDDVLLTAAVERCGALLGRSGRVARTVDGVAVDLTDFHPTRIRDALHPVAVALATCPLPTADGTAVLCDVGTGWAALEEGRLDDARADARAYATDSLRHNDLVVQPVLPGDGALDDPRGASRWMTAWQVAASLVVCLAVPLAALIVALRHGVDLAGGLYGVAVGAVVVTVTLQLTETLLALRSSEPPPLPAGPLPPATAVIAAYLPNEAATIMATVREFLALTYAGPLQIIVAFNSPGPLPVERELRDLADRDPRLLIVEVAGSTSKAQNVNAALGLATGTFVGVYDADHHPMPGAFERAWRWIAGGTDVVQGHCVVRNGGSSPVARLVAVEFEQIYAVGHVGRQRLHGFGVFGGSSGFWRTDVLRAVRMRGDRLTEDIDASIRALRSGHRIVNDRALISRELAPVTWSALWKQRIRWAQGWHEVSRYHWRAVTSAGVLTRRQRLGLSQLLVWRELYVWATPLIWVLLGFELWRDGSLSLTSPALLALTAVVLLCGPLQLCVAYRVADPSIRAHRSWWWAYALLNLVFYQELKNLIARVAQLKHAVGERHWTVTPRSVPDGPAATDGDPS